MLLNKFEKNWMAQVEMQIQQQQYSKETTEKILRKEERNKKKKKKNQPNEFGIEVEAKMLLFMHNTHTINHIVLEFEELNLKNACELRHN